MFASVSDISTLEDSIIYLLNATDEGFGGGVKDPRRSPEAITMSRRYAAMEVLRAIAANPSHGFWQEIATVTPLEHNALLPAFAGEIGSVDIVPFENAVSRSAERADPGEIDSWRNDTLGLYTRFFGVVTAHDQKDANNQQSRVAGFYSIQNNQIKFTGFSCAVALFIIDDDIVDTKLPYEYINTVTKLALKYHFKEGDNLPNTAIPIIQNGESELVQIRQGNMTATPIPKIMEVARDL